MMLSRVDLPQPEGPSRATNSRAPPRSTTGERRHAAARASRYVLETRSTTTRTRVAGAQRNRWILPVAVFGSSATKSTQRGDL